LKGKQSGQIRFVFHLADENDKPFEGEKVEEPKKEEKPAGEYEYYYVDVKSLSEWNDDDEKAKSLSSWSSSDDKAKSLSDTEMNRVKRKRRVLKDKGEAKPEKPNNEEKIPDGLVLNLKVVEARAVPAADGNFKCDPYLKLQFNSETKQTKAIQNNLSPVWNETFQFPVVDRQTDSLYITLWDEDLAKDDRLAEIKFNIREMTAGKVNDQWFDMKNFKGKENTQLHLVLNLAEKGAKPFVEANLKTLVLNLRLIEGADIPKADLVGKTDPFCKLGLATGTLSFQSKICDNTFTPQWNDTFNIALNGPSDILGIELWDHDASKDDIISKTQIPLGKYTIGQVVDDWFTLDPEPEFKKKGGGRIHLALQVAGDNDTPFQA